jgi:hypothetical protein
MTQQPIAETTYLVAVEVAHELVHELRARLRGWLNTVSPELFENVWTISEVTSQRHT